MCASKSKIETKAKKKSKYVQRDVHEIFFRPTSRQAEKIQKLKAKKTKPKILTDKERADFARRHWDEHHGKGADKSEDSGEWAAAADIPDESDKWVAATGIPESSMEDDTPQSPTPPLNFKLYFMDTQTHQTQITHTIFTHTIPYCD